MIDPRISTGLAALSLTREERRSPGLAKVLAAIEQEQSKLRLQLEELSNIETTTLMRGQLRMLKQILALSCEVGPESRQSEADESPESAHPARTAARFPVSFES